MSKCIRHIFFDFGRTIVEHPEDGAGLRIVKATGVTDEADAALIRNVVFSAAKYANDLDDGTITREQYKQLLRGDLPERLHDYALAAADYHISALPVLPGMLELLQKLKADGYKLYITSNLDEKHASEMKDTVIAPYFDAMLFSSHIRIRKPHAAFFETALAQFGVKAEECLFIDDLADNIAAAEACGIKSLLFRGDVAEAEAFIYAQA